MAFRRGGGGRQPKWSISFSVKIRDGEYKKGPSIGLWPADSGPMARGSCKGEYLEKLAAFFDRYARKSNGISVSLFENDNEGGGRSRRSRDDDDDYEDRRSRRKEAEEDDEEEEEEEEEDEENEEEEEEEEERPRRRKKKPVAKKKVAKKKKRKFG